MQYTKKIPYIILAIVTALWIIFFPFFKEDFISKFYFMPFLGIIAATVANTTPAAAGIVYFPILTHLTINPTTAVQFSLIIQAYGMGLGSFRWFLINRNLFLKSLIPIALVGGITGITLSSLFFPINNPEVLTLIFNFIALLFTQIIFFSILFNHSYPNMKVKLNLINVIFILFCSLLGGMISGWIGFGIDTMFYFILTVIYRVTPAISIITSIFIMAVVSLTGTILNILFHQVPFSLWYSAIPGVTIAGLFLAAYFAMKIGAKNVLILFTLFLSFDFFLTFWTQKTIPISYTLKMLITYALVAYLLVIHIKIFKQSYADINKNLGQFHSDELKI